MGAITSQITSLAIVFSTVYSDTAKRKHQSSASLASNTENVSIWWRHHVTANSWWALWSRWAYGWVTALRFDHRKLTVSSTRGHGELTVSAHNWFFFSSVIMEMISDWVKRFVTENVELLNAKYKWIFDPFSFKRQYNNSLRLLVYTHSGLVDLRHSTIKKSLKWKKQRKSSWCVCGWFGVCPEWSNAIVTHQMSKFCVRSSTTLQWRHNDHDCVSNHQPRGCLLNRIFRRGSKKTSKLRVTGLCVGNSPGPVNSPHKGPVTRKMFPFDDVIMKIRILWLCSIFYETSWGHFA